MPKFEDIDIEKIALGEPNVRKTDVDLGIDELAHSIEEQGLLQPIIVRKSGDEYELIAGQRRLTAVMRLGNHTIPAMIVDTSNPTTLMLISLIENVQRVDIDDRDRAAAVEKLVEANNGDYAAVAKMLGKRESTIRTWTGYHGVPDEIKDMKDKRLLDVQEAIKLTAMLGPSKAVKVAEEIVKLPRDKRQRIYRGLKKWTALEPEEVISIATRPPKEKPLTIKFMSSILTALERAAAARGEAPEETVKYIVREWLEKRHYIEASS
jgi:ParB family chromosome partitioning protein